MRVNNKNLEKAPASLAIISSDAHSIYHFRGSLISMLVKQGVTVYALAPYNASGVRDSLKEMGVITVNVSLSRGKFSILSDIFGIFKNAYILSKIKPTATLSYFIKPVIYGSFSSFLARVPHRVAMIEGLGYLYTKSRNLEGFKKKIMRSIVSLLYKLALKTTHKVIFLNKDDKVEFVDRRIVDKDKTKILGGIGVDLGEWSFSRPSVSPFTFIFVGRLLKEKGVFELMTAFRRISKEFPGVKLFILGDVDNSNPGSITRQKMENFANSVKCTWIKRAKTIHWLKKSSVFVLPSYREGVPRSTQEALSVGLPVITTDVPGCRETVINGKNGFLVPCCDATALYNAMSKFLENNDIVFDMSKRSREIAEARFDENVINERLFQILFSGRQIKKVIETKNETIV